MLKSVLTIARPPAGTTFCSAADRSNPADCGEPRVGILALGLRNLTWRTFDDILRECMKRIFVVVVKATSAEWRRRRSRGGMVAILLDFAVMLIGSSM